jgi:hypothetical protein
MPTPDPDDAPIAPVAGSYVKIHPTAPAQASEKAAAPTSHPTPPPVPFAPAQMQVQIEKLQGEAALMRNAFEIMHSRVSALETAQINADEQPLPPPVVKQSLTADDAPADAGAGTTDAPKPKK